MLLAESDWCLSLTAIAASTSLPSMVSPVAASNIKSVQFLQSLNLPVELTYISLKSLAVRPDFVTHFLPISDRLSPNTITVSIFSGVYSPFRQANLCLRRSCLSSVTVAFASVKNILTQLMGKVTNSHR